MQYTRLNVAMMIVNDYNDLYSCGVDKRVHLKLFLILQSFLSVLEVEHELSMSRLLVNKFLNTKMNTYTSYQ